MSGKGLKILGLVVTVLGAGVSIASNWVAEKNLDNKVTEKVAKALAEKNDN